MDDRVRICSNCALFGNHKNHDIRQEPDVISEVEERTESLIEIYEQMESN